MPSGYRRVIDYLKGVATIDSNQEPNSEEAKKILAEYDNLKLSIQEKMKADGKPNPSLMKKLEELDKKKKAELKKLKGKDTNNNSYERD
jgi:hypothetical protein